MKPAKLSIGFVLDDGLDKPDGVQQYILTLGVWLQRQGHAVHYLVGQTARTDIPNIHQMSRSARVRFNGNTMSNPFPAKHARVKEVLDHTQFDVLHVQVPYHPFMSARVIRAAGATTAIVGTFHILPMGRWQAWSTKLLGRYLRSSLRRFDAMLSVSEPAAQFARQTFGVESTVLSNVVDLARFRNDKPVRQPTPGLQIVFLGRLVSRKGCGHLLQALVLLRTQNLVQQGITVHIAGDGPERVQLERFSADHRLSGIVKFHGFVSEAHKVSLLQTADIAVFPSLGGESFGIVLVEAMAAGALVLGGDNPGYRSVLQDFPVALFDPRDSQTLASKLASFINDNTMRREISQAQGQSAAQYDVAVVGRKLLQLYYDCITAKKDG